MATNADALSASVTSLRSSLSLLDSSIAVLDAGIADFPRLSTVLKTTRHFELTPTSSLASAQASLASELGPAITTLLDRADNYLSKLERREQALIAKAELQEGRLSQGSGPTASNKAVAPPLSRRTTLIGGGGDEKAIKLKALRQKKERLNYAVERLQLQSQQRQRQLRMSVNFPRIDD